MSTIRFTFKPTSRDFLAFNYYSAIRIYRTLFVAGIFSVLLFLLQAPAYHRTGHQVSTMDVYRSNAGILILPAAVIFFLLMFHLSARRRWKEAEEVRLPRDYEIGESGIRVTSASFDGFLEWRHFIHADFRGGYFLLKTAQKQFHYFPITAVPDKGAFIQLVANKVPVSKRWLNA